MRFIFANSHMTLQVKETTSEFPVMPIISETDTDDCDWVKREPEDFEKYRDLCGKCDRPMLTKRELTAVADQIASRHNLVRMGRPNVRRKSGVMAWLEDHWGAVDETVRVGQILLPTKKRLRSSHAAQIRKMVGSRANSPSWLGTDFRVQLSTRPHPGTPTAERIEIEDQWDIEMETWDDDDSFDCSTD
jgi:hypothetical protein